MPPYDVIQSDADLAVLLGRLRGTGCARLALDMEGENNLHRYGIHVCLIQGFDGKRAFVVDALSIRDPGLFRALLQDSPWLKIMFDTTSDLLAFQHGLGVRPAPIVDLAVAAQLLGRTGGLGEVAGLEGSKRSKDRFQRANWMRRPIPRDMLDYAVSDVLPLLDLADALMAELGRKDLVLEFMRRNWERQSRQLAWNPLGNFGRIPGYTRMSAAGKRMARTLWYAREYYARRLDVPPENVASKLQLKRIVDEGVRDPERIAQMLNEGRKRALVDPRDFAQTMAEAERDAGAAGD